MENSIDQVGRMLGIPGANIRKSVNANMAFNRARPVVDENAIEVNLGGLSPAERESYSAHMIGEADATEISSRQPEYAEGSDPLNAVAVNVKDNTVLAKGSDIDVGPALESQANPDPYDDHEATHASDDDENDEPMNARVKRTVNEFRDKHGSSAREALRAHVRDHGKWDKADEADKRIRKALQKYAEDDSNWPESKAKATHAGLYDNTTKVYG